MNNERFMAPLFRGRVWRRNMKTLQKIIHALCIFLHFIHEECEFRNDPRVVSDSITQSLADFLLVLIEFVQRSLLVFGQHHADVYPGQAKVWAHPHFHDGNECVAQHSPLIALEYVAQLFLNQTANFLLSYGTTHSVKIVKPSPDRFPGFATYFFGYLRRNSTRVLRYFRINDPYRLLALLVLMMLACLPLLIETPDLTLQELRDMIVGERVGSSMLYVDLVDRTPPLMAVLDGVMNFFLGRSLFGRHLLALFILFFQAAYFAILLIQNRAYNENTYVPSLIFGALCFLSFDLVSPTPEVFASTLLLFALNNIFKEIEFRIDRDTIALTLGLYIGLASLVILSYAVFLPGAILILILFAHTSMRKIFLVLIGFGLAHGILFTLYYYAGHTQDLWQHYYLANLNVASGPSVSFRTLAVVGILPAVYLMLSLIMLTRDAHFTKYQSQIFQVMFLWLILATIVVWLEPGIAPHSFIIFLPPLAYFVSHYLLLIRRRRIAEFMLWIFLVGILATSTASQKDWIPGVGHTGLFVTPSPYENQIRGKRVMVVGDDPGLYRNNSLGGGFFDWELSREYFEHPEYYEHAIRVSHAFEHDAPEVIVDMDNRMEAVLQRLPAVQLRYVKEGVIYRLR
jgi:hypothetical protein